MTSAKPTRINARLPPDLARKAGYLERRLNLSTTEVIHRAIERYYDQITEESCSAEEICASEGFIGCAEGAPDLSGSYKAELTRSLGKKA